MQPTKGLISGAFFIATGLLFLVTAVISYDMGTLARMGPAYFPSLCGGALILVGMGSVLTAGREENARPERLHLRPVAFVGLSLGAFALMVDRFGFVIALSVSVLVVSFARRDIPLVGRLIMAAGITAALVVLFRVLLRAPIPVWPEF